MQRRDPYRILGVARNADRATIEAAYRALVRQYHPDVNASPDATTRMQDINWARDVLTDPRKRLLYEAEIRWPTGTYRPPSNDNSAADDLHQRWQQRQQNRQTWEWQQASSQTYTTPRRRARNRAQGLRGVFFIWLFLSMVVRACLADNSGDRNQTNSPQIIITWPPPGLAVSRLPGEANNLQWPTPTPELPVFTAYKIRDEATLLWAEGLLRDSGHNTTVVAIGGYVLKYTTASNGYYCPPGAYTEGERPQLTYCKTLRNITPPGREY